MTILFLTMIATISIGSLVLKDREFSPNENRYLAKFPSISAREIDQGTFQDGFEKYLSDQIVGRDVWITIRTTMLQVMGQRDIGGAYLGQDGYDFEKIIPEDVDEKHVAKNTASVKEYLAYCDEVLGEGHTTFMLVPTSGLVLEDKLPKHAILFDQTAYIAMIKEEIPASSMLDVSECLLAHSDEPIYYRTDHHWTTHGAYYAYEAWGNKTGHDVKEKEEYELDVVTASFRGSLYSKILNGDTMEDEITIYKDSNNASYQIVADGEELPSFYIEEKLLEKDKYAYFFGGNYGEMVIRQENSTGKGKLLVIKDSFANSFLPFIADQYDEIYVVDLRYCMKDMNAYLEENEIDDVLILYNVSNFISDKNIYKLDKGRGR